MRIIGIDPGIQNTGWAIIDGDNLVCCASIATKPAWLNEHRLLVIKTNLLAAMANWRVELCSIEKPFVNPRACNYQSFGKLMQAKAAAEIAAAEAKIVVTEYDNTTIKKAITGSGKADKRAIGNMAAAIFGHKPRNSHIADAIAIAVTHQNRIMVLK